MAYLADISVLQGSVATYARCGGIFNMHLTANLPRNLPVKIFLIGSDLTELWSRVCGPAFLAHPVYPTFDFLEAGWAKIFLKLFCMCLGRRNTKYFSLCVVGLRRRQRNIYKAVIDGSCRVNRPSVVRATRLYEMGVQCQCRGGSRGLTKVTSHTPLARQHISCYK